MRPARILVARLAVLACLAVAAVLVLAAPAFAVGDAGRASDIALPIQWGALVAIAITSVVLPYWTAFWTDADAPDWVKSLTAAVGAGLAAVAAWAVDVVGVPDWKTAVGVFFAALVGAAGYRKTVGSPNAEGVVYRTGAHIGR